MEEDLAILMADLTGYTAMTHAHGGASAAKIVGKYMQLVDTALVGSAQAVQRIGDQVVIISKNSDDLLATSMNLNKLTSDEHQFLSIHAGIHYGPVFLDNNNLFGSTINIASRIMNVAQRAQILCSRSFLLQLQESLHFRSIGFHKLKNVVEEFELFELLSKTEYPQLLFDPVCHMQLDPEKENYPVTLADTTFYFCSQHCRGLFEKSPGSFVSNM